MNIAVLLTTYNRKAKTLGCLQSLMNQRLPKDVALEIFLTDDNSSDGTAYAVQTNFRGVHIFRGTGDMYWAGGMRHSWRKAIPYKPDYYLLLNDDTTLLPDAISLLLSTGDRDSISVGCTCDQNSGMITYGGWRRSSPFRWKSDRVHAPDKVMPCDFANANILLVPDVVVAKIGILADHFTHGLADYDYTLKARKAGFTLHVTPGFLGTCTNDHGNAWLSRKTTLKERLEFLRNPKGHAYEEFLQFIRDHFPFSYPAEFLKLWAKTFVPGLWDALKR